MDACPFCGRPVCGEGEPSLAVHLRRDCEEIPLDPVDAMTPGSSTDVGESADNRPSGTQGKQGMELCAPGDQLPPGDFTFDALNRDLSTETQDVEVTK